MSKCSNCGKELTTSDLPDICITCKNRQFEDKPKNTFGMYGWICPRCGTVHSPFSSRCDCPPPTHTMGTTQY